jgi:hypothetical protein
MTTRDLARTEEDLSQVLPTEAFNKGYRLVWYNPVRMPRDPTILFFRGVEVFRWEHDPLMGEVLDKIKELEKAENEQRRANEGRPALSSPGYQGLRAEQLP